MGRPSCPGRGEVVVLELNRGRRPAAQNHGGYWTTAHLQTIPDGARQLLRPALVPLGATTTSSFFVCCGFYIRLFIQKLVILPGPIEFTCVLLV
jgi:hypothetical protein